MDQPIEQKVSLRNLKRKVEDDSKVIDDLVKAILAKYQRDLDDFVDWCRDLMKRPHELETGVVEQMVLKLPLFMYYTSDGLETLGIEGDSAKAIRQETFNLLFTQQEGTIPDKERKAQLNTINEIVIEVAFTRAYKKLKTKLENAKYLYDGAKKVYDKRIAEMQLARQDRGQIQPGVEQYGK